jgi:pimeloyl-ACP methyl ester carboxylesterase
MVDWLTLKPKNGPRLAWRPVLLLHGWGATSAEMQAGTAWADALTLREVAFHAVDLPPKGLIQQNSAEVTRAVDDMKRRFGVDRVHVVGHSKGGIDARDHARTHDDVDVLVMLGTPNGGSFLADHANVASLTAVLRLITQAFAKYGEMTSTHMQYYNRGYPFGNKMTTYVSVAGDFDEAKWIFPSDEVVEVISVHTLIYSDKWTFETSTKDPEYETNRGICYIGGLENHSCLRHYRRFIDDTFVDGTM